MEVAFRYEAECRLIRRYDGGWMDIWRYHEPALVQDPIHYHRLQGSTHWRTTMDLLWHWARTIDRWPRRYSKFTVECPRDPAWGSFRVNVWVPLSAPTSVPARQTCRAFRRQRGGQPA